MFDDVAEGNGRGGTKRDGGSKSFFYLKKLTGKIFRDLESVLLLVKSNNILSPQTF